MGPRFGRPPARAYDEYLKAYSVAMLPGRERENVSYGGKSVLQFILFLLTDPYQFSVQSFYHRLLWPI